MKNGQESITLEDLRQGSEKALRQIYEANRDKFLNFARKFGLTEDDNIDIYQDAYIIFYDNVMEKKLQRFTSSISTYLFSIGKHLILDKIRKNKKLVSHKLDVSLVKEDDHIMQTIEMESQDLTSEQELLAKQFVALAKKCQELLTLYYYRGFTIKEIMKKNNYNSENVVKSTKSRCLKTLKERIKEHCE